MRRKANVTFGQRLRQLRESLGLSLREVADAANISATYLSRLERDRSGKPSDQIVFDLASRLQTNPDELLALLGRMADDLRLVVISQPAEWGGVLLAGSGFPAKEVAKVRAYTEKLRARLGLPDE